MLAVPWQLHGRHEDVMSSRGIAESDEERAVVGVDKCSMWQVERHVELTQRTQHDHVLMKQLFTRRPIIDRHRHVARTTTRQTCPISTLAALMNIHQLPLQCFDTVGWVI